MLSKLDYYKIMSDIHYFIYDDYFLNYYDYFSYSFSSMIYKFKYLDISNFSNNLNKKFNINLCK